MNAVPSSRPQVPPAAPARSSAVLTLLAHVDAANNLEPYEVAEVDHFEQAARPDTNVRVELSRTSSSPIPGIVMGAAEMLSTPVAMALAPALGPLGLGLTALSMMLTFDGAQRLADGLHSRMLHREPAWNGTRTYDIGADRVKGRLDSKIVAQSDDPHPGVADLTKFIADGMKAYPAQVTAFMASGHGLAYRACSGYKVDSLRQAMDDAAKQAGRKLDVVILEACLMGNLESLQTLKDSARYAIVSEETMGAAGLPWQKILADLPKDSLTPSRFSQIVANRSMDTKGIDTLAVVDLQKVGKLSASVENLAHELRRVVAQGGKSQVRAALKAATPFPHHMGPFSRMSFNVRDLGDIADAVEVGVADPKASEAAVKVKAALLDAVPFSTTSRKYGNSGHVTIQSLQPRFDTEEYVDKTGFTEWGALLQDLKR